MNATYAKCHCRFCNGPIEFDTAYAGYAQPCPHCGLETDLIVPPPPKPEPPKTIPAVSRLRPCPDCGHQVSPRAETCPNCGYAFRLRLKVHQVVLRVIGTVILLLLVLWLISGLFLTWLSANP